jgi:hypothetical protein
LLDAVQTPELPLTRHTLVFQPIGAGRLPRYPGSAWRGGFGHALKRTVCVMRLRPCQGCPLERSCIYPTVFETAPGEQAAKMRRYERVPHPYVLQPPECPPARLGERDEVSLGVTLVGWAGRYVAYVVRALQDAADRGLGPDRLTLELLTVGSLSPNRQPGLLSGAVEPGLLAESAMPSIPACPPEVEVVQLSPLRVQREGRLVGPADFRPGDLLSNLIRRVSMLTYFFTDHPLETDFRALADLARRLQAKRAELGWVDIVRRSSRQDALMRMGGIVGRFVLPLQGAEPLWPYLWLGQWIGAGKGATMGLG